MSTFLSVFNKYKINYKIVITSYKTILQPHGGVKIKNRKQKSRQNALAFSFGREWRKNKRPRRWLTKGEPRQKRSFFSNGAGGGSRTHTVLPPRDFKSRASAIPPHQHIYFFKLERRPIGRHKFHNSQNYGPIWRYHPDLNRGMKVLQTLALPLGDGTTGAEDGIRTRDICLGKATLYH